MHRIFFLLLLFMLPGLPAAAQTQLSSSARVSLLTCAPGDELYSVFGHSALRVFDPEQGLDRVYNYGIFDFDTPNFYVKFVRGQLPYKLGVQQLAGFLREYQYYSRSVSEQMFLLQQNEKQAVYNFLENNYKPENRFYMYDFFYDNCASRIVDVIDTVLTPQLNWAEQPQGDLSFRQLINPYIVKKPWTDLGLDLILGLESDRIATFRQQMFLPDYIPLNLSKLSIDRDSFQQPLLGIAQPVLQFDETEEVPPWWKYPAPIFWILCIAVAILTFFVPRKHFLQRLDLVWFGISGLAGALFLFMWLGTDHEACHRNMNMLWANPFYLLLLPAFYKRLPRWWETMLLLLFGVFNLIVIVGWKWLPQEFHIAVIPLAVLLLLRIGFRLWPVFKNKRTL